MLTYDEASLLESTFYINDCVIIDNDYGAALDWIYSRFPTTTCPFCSFPLASLPFLVDEQVFACDDEEYLGYEGRKAELRTCAKCTYWQWYFENGLDLNSYGCPDHFWHAALSKVKEFSSELPSGCHSEIAVALRRNPSLFHCMQPHVQGGRW